MKRLIDILGSLFLLSILLLPSIVISILIKFDSKGPILHFSKRIGHKSKPFKMPKFRTMLTSTPQIETNKLRNPSGHITKLGKFLRLYSLDEMPQIYTILQGKMSFVGPRPLLFNQYKLLKKRKNLKLHLIKPGLTGLAQVSGRDFLKDSAKLKLDYNYMKNQNFFLDFKIMIKTFFLVINKKNIKH
jgi:O-antigen biosynthesis protein WbqP